MLGKGWKKRTDERKETTKAHQSETSKKSNEMENLRTREELILISRQLAKANSNIRQLETDLAIATVEVEELNHRLRAANESKIKIENTIRREQNERERLTAALAKARGFSSESALSSENMQLVDTLGVTKAIQTTVSDDGFEAIYVGGVRTTDAGVRGVAVLENFIYVLYQSQVEGSCIRVFYDKTMKFRLTKVIKLPLCWELEDLASNPEDQCLYVTDSRTNYFPIVWKVTPENDQVTEWVTYQISLTLSVSLSGHVLILYDRHDYNKYYLDVLLSTAMVLHTYELPHDKSVVPLAVVETSKRNFIISCWVKTSFNKSTWCIYKMNADAQIIRRFIPGDDPSQRLYNPRFLFIDSYDRVIVGVSGHNRVILLDPNLNWNGVLLKRDSDVMGDYSPRAFVYDNSTNQIFIAPNYHEVQQIDVYTLKLRPPDEMESKGDPSYQSPALACAHINQLPDVVIERILLKACLFKSSSLETEDLLALVAVDYNWHHQLKNKRLHQQIKRKLAAQTRAVHCRKLTVRNNQKYFIESIQPVAKVAQLQEGAVPSRERGLIDRLHEAECLSDKQLRLVKGRNQRSRDVNKELLKIARSFDVMQYATFVECLRQTNQMTSADVLERGGVTVEMKLTLTKESKRFTEEIVSSMNKIRDKMFPQKKEFEELIVQLMVHEIEILGAQKTNKDIIVVWLWCYSQESLSRLRELNMSIGHLPSHLFDITQKLVKTISQAIVVKMLHIEEKQLLQDVSVCPIPIEIRNIRNIRGKEFYGVVKFNNKICILSQKPKLLQVCSERAPFALEKSVEIKKIQNPGDMTAGPDCLYIKESFIDKTNKKEVKCVSKIIFESEDFDQHRVLPWLPNIKESFTFSVCRDGSLLLMRDSESPTLEIYGSRPPNDSEASLVRIINLDKDFCRLKHAVETENGNFVVSHFLANNSQCYVSEINKSGQTVRRFNPRDDSQQLTSAFALALDSHGRVFVADRNNNQVVLLDSQLKWIQVVLSAAKDGITEPVALWYDEKIKQLVAAQCFTRKAYSSRKNPVTMDPAIYVVDIPAFSKAL